MRRGPRVSLLLGLASALLGASARAEPVNRVAIHVADECEPYLPEIERRLSADVGSLPSGLAASVSIESSESGYLVTLATRDSEGTRGTTRIAAPTCGEAVDATVEVLALALSESDPEDTSVAPRQEGVSGYRTDSASGASSEPASTAPLSPAVQSSAPVDRGVHEDPRVTQRSRRASFAAGVDVGTLPDPSLSLSGGFVQSLAAVELGGIIRYVPATTNESVETEFTESVRRDFAALELRACYGTGERFRLSACSGAEVGAVRVARRFESEDGTDQDEDTVTARLAGTLAAVFAHRGGLIEPEVEIAGAAVAFGRENTAPWLVVRVAAGAAVAF